uniref:Glucosaminyl (N-acetyl) transferase family member 7 n=1 Tax=Cynoglossus semilaevis TaxID=244447 RepID=A0A3P8WQR1_CYNSE
MNKLNVTKCSFLLCLGFSIIICSVIYLRVGKTTDPNSIEPFGCKPLPNQCQAFLSSTDNTLFVSLQLQGYILNSHRNCYNLTRELHFITRPLSREEEDYPMAFIITIHKELEVFVRLLRAIYMPQNVYCIHVDAKAPWEYQAAVQKIIGCFQNVFLSSRSEIVTYAGFSRLQADLNCLRDLAKSKIRWKKVVNLCGQDFPIMSNLELVQYMQSQRWRDRNMTPGTKQPVSIKQRTEQQHLEIPGSHVKALGRKKSPAPHNLQVYFGTAYFALTRGFVDFVLESTIARDLLEWSRDTFSPDEHYWVTLNHVEEAPGSYVNGNWEGDIRAIKWSDQEGVTHNGCKGHYVHNICIYGIGDLPWLINKNSMFANKFESNSFPETVDCLEEWHRQKVLSQSSVPVEPPWLLVTKSNSSSSS